MWVRSTFSYLIICIIIYSCRIIFITHRLINMHNNCFRTVILQVLANSPMLGDILCRNQSNREEDDASINTMISEIICKMRAWMFNIIPPVIPFFECFEMQQFLLGKQCTSDHCLLFLVYSFLKLSLN